MRDEPGRPAPASELGAASASASAGGEWGEGALVLEDVSKHYRLPRHQGRGRVDAVKGVSFTMQPGSSLGLVGASGSGKSTIARLVTAMERPSSGTIRLGEVRVDNIPRRAQRRYWGLVQLVFQDPYAALNPLNTVGYALARPVANHQGLAGRALRAEVHRLLETVELTPVAHFEAKLPHQLSGGQRQRVIIARALAARPRVLVADEPVSMLDVSLRVGVLRLLDDLRRQTGVSLLYITHDLLSARVVTENLIVLEHGRIVERGPTLRVLRWPEHQYTKELIASIPVARGPRAGSPGNATPAPPGAAPDPKDCRTEKKEQA